MNNRDRIKAFGMTNQLIEADLDLVEGRFGVKLGHRDAPEEDHDELYYPQFDSAVREEAAQMRQHYELFYCLEKSIRQVITDGLQAEAGSNWWDSGRVPTKIHTDVADRIRRDLDSGTTLRSTQPIDFTNFGELGEIIKANWDVFGSTFNSKRAITKIMANLNVVRGPIAHCSALAEDEILRLQLSVRDWFRQME